MTESLRVERDTQAPAAAVSREIVQCLKDSLGRGPTKAKTYFHSECVVVLLREGHTRGEETLKEGGGRRAVAQGRVDLSETIRQPLIDIVQGNTGRRVLGFMSSSQQDPDLLSFVFVLENAEVLTAVPPED